MTNASRSQSASLSSLYAYLGPLPQRRHLSFEATLWLCLSLIAAAHSMSCGNSAPVVTTSILVSLVLSRHVVWQLLTSWDIVVDPSGLSLARYGWTLASRLVTPSSRAETSVASLFWRKSVWRPELSSSSRHQVDYSNYYERYFLQDDGGSEHDDPDDHVVYAQPRLARIRAFLPPRPVCLSLLQGLTLLLGWITWAQRPSTPRQRSWTLLATAAAPLMSESSSTTSSSPQDLPEGSLEAGNYPLDNPGWFRLVFPILATGPTLTWVVLGGRVTLPTTRTRNLLWDWWFETDLGTSEHNTQHHHHHHHHHNRRRGHDTVDAVSFRRREQTVVMLFLIWLTRWVEGIILVAILPRTVLPRELFLSSILSPAGVVTPGRPKEMWLNETNWLSISMWILSTGTVVTTLYIANVLVTHRATLAWVGLSATDWQECSSSGNSSTWGGSPTSNSSKKLPQWDGRKKYSRDDVIMHRGQVYRAMVAHPTGTPRPRWIRNILSLWQDEVGPTSTSRVLMAIVVPFQRNVTMWWAFVSFFGMQGFGRWMNLLANVLALHAVVHSGDPARRQEMKDLASTIGLSPTSTTPKQR